MDHTSTSRLQQGPALPAYTLDHGQDTTFSMELTEQDLSTRSDTPEQCAHHPPDHRKRKVEHKTPANSRGRSILQENNIRLKANYKDKVNQPRYFFRSRAISMEGGDSWKSQCSAALRVIQGLHRNRTLQSGLVILVTFRLFRTPLFTFWHLPSSSMDPP